MTNRDELASSLWGKIQASQTLSELTQLLDAVDTHRQQGDLDDPTCLRLLRAGLRAIPTIAPDDLTAAESAIMVRLLPLVLQTAPDGDHDIHIELSNLRQLLAEWIDKLPDELRDGLRERVLALLMEALAGEELRPACWTIAEIGYRNQQVIDKLWSIVETDRHNRAPALSAIVALGVTAETREQVLNAITDDLRSALPRQLLYLLHELAAPETAEYVLHFITALENAEEDPRSDLLTSQSLLNRILDASWDDHDLQLRVWSRLSQIAEKELRRGRPEFDLRSEVGRDCNTPDVITYYLKTLVEVVQGKARRIRGPWLPLQRLNKCLRPLHMEGWSAAGDCTEFTDTLGQLAREDTKHDSNFATAESQVKQDIWNHLLSIGARQALAWVEDAVANETSPFVQSDVLECAACLAFPHLPPPVIRLVTDEFNAEPKSDAGQFIARLSATKLARSAATPEAFESLLNFGLTHGGSILLSSLRAIGDVAVLLVKAGNDHILSMLTSLALEASTERRREGAVAGLHALAEAGLLRKEAELLSHLVCW